MVKYLLLFFITIFSSYSFAFAKTNEHLFVISSVVINAGTNKKINNFVDMIEKDTGYKLKPFYVNSYDRLSEILRKNPDSLAWTCGLPYIEDSLKDNQQLVAVPLYNEKPTYSSFIVARKDDTRKNFTDFKNSIFSYSDIRSNSGYLAPAVFLKKNGFNIDEFFRVKILTGTHEDSIKSVYNGLADVAAIDEYVWIEYIKSRPHISDKLYVIEKTGPYPFTPIVAGSAMTEQTLKKIRSSLVNMNKSKLKTFKNDFNMDGFILKNKSFYNPIQQMLNYVNGK